MAKIKFGMMMTDARGKLGGQVFSKNRSGAYVRTKVTPVNPQTSFQQANRALLGNLSANWSGLTAPQRESWNSAVESWQKTNVFGDLTKPTGKNLFTGLNKNRSAHFPALPLQVVPPSKSEFVPFQIASASYNRSSGVFTIQMREPFAETISLRIRVTPGLSAGTTYVKNQMRTIGTTYNMTEEGIITISNDYDDRFGTQPLGSVIGVELTQIAETGQLGVPVLILVTTA